MLFSSCPLTLFNSSIWEDLGSVESMVYSRVSRVFRKGICNLEIAAGRFPRTGKFNGCFFLQGKGLIVRESSFWVATGKSKTSSQVEQQGGLVLGGIRKRNIFYSRRRSFGEVRLLRR